MDPESGQAVFLWNTRTTPQPADPRAIEDAFIPIDDIDKDGNPPIDETLPNPEMDRMNVRIITTCLDDAEPHHWVVLLAPHYNNNPDTICTWYHVFFSPEAGVGYTSLIERASANSGMVQNNWRSSEYVCWIATVAHGEMIKLLDECVDRANRGRHRWLRLFMCACVDLEFVDPERAVEIEWVVLPAEGEPGENEAYPLVHVPRLG
ncbi:hypothetical protein BJY00DRAFT_313187 [Aspergillus carlsbadensis]|nr:hypothetical protein BJY00DRAFT_313187 [Aspergillus carlsbadensis]